MCTFFAKNVHSNNLMNVSVNIDGLFVFLDSFKNDI